MVPGEPGAPHADGFEFRHHDVLHDVLNPTGTPGHLPLPIGDGDVTLFIAWSVFTHLLEADADFYLRELARVLHPGGVAVSTWFTFDKSDYPMMQEFQNALYIHPGDLTNAVIFDRAWILDRLEQAGLVATRIVPPKIKGFQWMLYLERTRAAAVPPPSSPKIARRKGSLDRRSASVALARFHRRWIATSPPTPHCKEAVPPFEKRGYHVPFPGRYTAMSALPSPSKSAGTGTSPPTPH